MFVDDQIFLFCCNIISSVFGLLHNNVRQFMTLLYICGDVLNFLGMQGYHMKSANIDGSKVLDFSSNIPSCSILCGMEFTFLRSQSC